MSARNRVSIMKVTLVLGAMVAFGACAKQPVGEYISNPLGGYGVAKFALSDKNGVEQTCQTDADVVKTFGQTAPLDPRLHEGACENGFASFYTLLGKKGDAGEVCYLDDALGGGLVCPWLTDQKYWCPSDNASIEEGNPCTDDIRVYTVDTSGTVMCFVRHAPAAAMPTGASNGKKGECECTAPICNVDGSQIVTPSCTTPGYPKPESCNNTDDDCDGVTDNSCDKDGDGYCDVNMAKDVTLVAACPSTPVTATTGDDCDDNDKNVHPSATEACNGKDDNCNGVTDEGFNFTDASGAVVTLGGACVGIGECGTGKVECAAADTKQMTTACSSNPNGSASQAKPEQCDDKDNNCDGATDEKCDKDGDGWCDASMMTVGKPKACPSGGDDCDDNDKNVHPSATEACNGKDDNCNGFTDENNVCSPINNVSGQLDCSSTLSVDTTGTNTSNLGEEYWDCGSKYPDVTAHLGKELVYSLDKITPGTQVVVSFATTEWKGTNRMFLLKPGVSGPDADMFAADGTPGTDGKLETMSSNLCLSADYSSVAFTAAAGARLVLVGRIYVGKGGSGNTNGDIGGEIEVTCQ